MFWTITVKQICKIMGVDAKIIIQLVDTKPVHPILTNGLLFILKINTDFNHICQGHIYVWYCWITGFWLVLQNNRCEAKFPMSPDTWLRLVSCFADYVVMSLVRRKTVSTLHSTITIWHEQKLIYSIMDIAVFYANLFCFHCCILPVTYSRLLIFAIR